MDAHWAQPGRQIRNIRNAWRGRHNKGFVFEVTTSPECPSRRWLSQKCCVSQIDCGGRQLENECIPRGVHFGSASIFGYSKETVQDTVATQMNFELRWRHVLVRQIESHPSLTRHTFRRLINSSNCSNWKQVNISVSKYNTWLTLRQHRTDHKLEGIVTSLSTTYLTI